MRRPTGMGVYIYIFIYGTLICGSYPAIAFIRQSIPPEYQITIKINDLRIYRLRIYAVSL